jgi:hypothetical protein
LEDLNLATKLTLISSISGFRRDVDDICVLLGYYLASCGNYLPTFRDNVSVPSSRVKSPSMKESKPATYNVDHGKSPDLIINIIKLTKYYGRVKLWKINCMLNCSVYWKSVGRRYVHIYFALF